MRYGIGLSIAALAGFLFALLWLERPTADPRMSAEAEAAAFIRGSASDLAGLRAELQQERELRKRSEKEAARLEIALEELIAAAAEDAQGAVGDGDGEGEETIVAKPGGKTSSGDLGFKDQALVGIGMDAEAIARIRERWDKFQLDLLYYHDQNARGERTKAEQRRDRVLMETQLAQDLGEAHYDALLYASDQNNRIVVTNVMADSEAAWVGLAVGDHVIRYDDLRTWKPRDLKLASRAGEKGELTRIEVWRRDHIETMYVKRGPIGIQMEPKVLRPLPGR